MKQLVSSHYDVDMKLADYLVFEDCISNNAYTANKSNINILYKDGSLKDIAEASDQLNISALSKKVVTKHFSVIQKNVNFKLYYVYEISVQQIADLIEGSVEGDGKAIVSSLSKIEEGKEGTLSFLANPQYTPFIYHTKATAVIINNDFVIEKNVSTTLIRVKDAYQSFGKLLKIFNKLTNNQSGIHKTASIDETAKLGKDIFIGSLVHIGKIQSLVEEQKSILKHLLVTTTVGDNCILHAGVLFLTTVL